MSVHSNSMRRASTQGEGEAPVPSVVLVAQGHDGESTYAMFDVRELAPAGAFLAGALLLEMNEEVELEIDLADGSPLRVRARVVRLERGEDPGMEVVFPELGEEEHRRIERLALTAEPSRRQYGRDH